MPCRAAALLRDEGQAEEQKDCSCAWSHCSREITGHATKIEVYTYIYTLQSIHRFSNIEEQNIGWKEKNILYTIKGYLF